jgi:hypothetical protein
MPVSAGENDLKAEAAMIVPAPNKVCLMKVLRVFIRTKFQLGYIANYLLKIKESIRNPPYTGRIENLPGF